MLPADCPPPDDFLARVEAIAAPVRPAPCSVLTQTPPELTWPRVSEGEWRVTLTFPDGHAETRATPDNWLAWDRPLPPGEYRWTVATAAGEESEPRRFTVARGAVAFIIPGDDQALARARSMPRPRTWPHGDDGPLGAIRDERAWGFAALLKEVESKMQAGVQPEPKATSVNANYDDTVAEQKRTLAAALAFAVTGKRRYGADAARRLVAQARWSPAGALAFRENDMGARTVAWTLALGYDWAHDALDEAQKRAVLEAIRVRTQEMYDVAIAPGELFRRPADSHGNLTLAIVAAIAALTAGDIPEAEAWLRGTLRAAAVWTSPWGGADGGFANGTMQGQWDLGANLLAWYVLEHATGVPLSRKEWVRNHARYLAYFVPPGAPANLFGDGQEMQEPQVRARVALALAAFSPSPIAAWYASHFDPDAVGRVEWLLAPRAKRGPAPSSGFPNAAAFPSIGWVAMHSDLEDPRRTSVYFRSSPYGSHNHGHADQNGFVIDHAGERLAIKSGYYDDYGTPHWKDWYKQTRSANAITFDGGQGQGIDGMENAGEIVEFASDGRVDRVVGRAEAAYGGALTLAERTLTYDRERNEVTVHDRLAAAEPRTWEWNLHAFERLEADGDTRFGVRRGRARMCVELVDGPPVAFTQTDAFTTPPAGKREPQWHGRFATREKLAAAEFVVVLRIGRGCG